ncbi:MAG TPA: hypothetical protein DEB31_01520, partial [Clostridiales bacterium]|nr:hypothetical protein [Clostridiales bacterium]
AGDFDRVKADHAAFEKSMEALLDEIDGALTEIDARAGKPAAAAPDPALLAELRAACEAFDMDGVDKAMTRLASFRYEKGEELVAWLRDQINDMAFEQIGGADVGSLLKKFGLPGAT